MFKQITAFIDSTTMYRLLMYYLIGLLVVSFGLSMFGHLNYKPIYIVISTVIAVGACWTINKGFEYIFNAPVNYESSIITGLILALIITPNPTGFGLLFLLAASGLAMASKYLITIRNKHIFNPAAVAVALTAIGPKQTASWWIGTAILVPFVIAGGIFITIKLRRQKMVLSFFLSAAIATVVYSIIGRSNILTNLHNMALSSPLFFLGFVMLTEPLTSPPTSNKQMWYGALVGILLPPQAHVLKFYSSPELSLLAGNVFSYIISPKVKLFPRLKEKVQIAANTFELIFAPQQSFSFEPGQYIEFTLSHTSTDSRGSRRVFTIASSPTEEDLRIGVKFYENGSSFKEALFSADEQSLMTASQIAGDFTMPHDTNKKLAFIAGGIGVTPFRSMLKYLIDSAEPRDITVLYSARTDNDIAYRDIFEEARQKLGIQTTYALSESKSQSRYPNTIYGFITSEMIEQYIPDYLDRIFYISGTHPMVQAMHAILSDLGVHRSNIVIDYFPGYA